MHFIKISFCGRSRFSVHKNFYQTFSQDTNRKDHHEKEHNKRSESEKVLKENSAESELLMLLNNEQHWTLSVKARFSQTFRE